MQVARSHRCHGSPSFAGIGIGGGTGAAQAKFSDNLGEVDDTPLGECAKAVRVQRASVFRTFGNEFSASALAEKAGPADGLDGADSFLGHI